MPVQLDQDVLQAFIDSGGEIVSETPPATGATVDLNPADVPATEPAAKPSPFPTQKVATVVQGAVDRVAAPAGRMHDSIAAQPTPGGVGVLLLALMFFVWAVVPFGGHTRLEWLWYTLTGRARLKGRKDLKQRASVGLGGTGDSSVFDSPPPSSVPPEDDYISMSYQPEYDAFTPDMYDDESVFS